MRVLVQGLGFRGPGGRKRFGRLVGYSHLRKLQDFWSQTWLQHWVVGTLVIPPMVDYCDCHDYSLACR